MILILLKQFNEDSFGPILIKMHVGADVIDVVFGGGIVDSEHLETVGEVGLYLQRVVLVLGNDGFQA